jgi:hypothetical protein
MAAAQYLLCNFHRAGTLRLLPWSKEHPNRDFPFRLEGRIQALSFTGEKCGRQLHRNPRAVTARAVRVNRAAVREAPKALKRLLDDSMRGRLAQLGDKPYAASIVLFPMIESCPRGGLQVTPSGLF